MSDFNINGKKSENQIENNYQVKKKIVSYIIFTIIFIGISVLSLFSVYHLFSDKSVFVTLSIFSFKVLLKSCILLIFYFLFDSLRLYYTLQTLDVNVKLRYIIKLAFVNIFVSNITPFATGGGFAQIYFLNKKGIPIGDATAASTIRTVLPIIFFSVFTPLILFFNKSAVRFFPEDNLFYTVAFILIYLVIVYKIYKSIQNPKTIKKFVYKLTYFLGNRGLIKNKKKTRVVKKIFEEVDRFSAGMGKFLHGNKKYLSLSIIYTLLFLLSLFVFSVILIRGLNPYASPLQIIMLQVIITFLMYFAPTPGATGVAEGGFTLLFANFVSGKNIVSLTFAWRFFTIYFGMVVGMVLFYVEMFKNSRQTG